MLSSWKQLSHMPNLKEQTQKFEYFDNNFFNFLKLSMKYLKKSNFSRKKVTLASRI